MKTKASINEQPCRGAARLLPRIRHAHRRPASQARPLQINPIANRLTMLLTVMAFVATAFISFAQDAGGPPPGPGGGGGSGGPRGLRLLPPRAQEQLNLTDEQQQKITALEAELKAKFEKILTPEQQQKLQQLRPQQRQGGSAEGNTNRGMGNGSWMSLP